MEQKAMDAKLASNNSLTKDEQEARLKLIQAMTQDERRVANNIFHKKYRKDFGKNILKAWNMGWRAYELSSF